MNVVDVLFGAILLAWIVMLPRYWTRGVSILESTPTWSRLRRDALLRGAMRALPVMVVLFVVPYVLMHVPDFPDARSGRQPEWLGWFFTVYGLVFVLLPVSLILLNWPKQLVPPRFRHEPGMVSEWRGQDGAVSRFD